VPVERRSWPLASALSVRAGLDKQPFDPISGRFRQSGRRGGGRSVRLKDESAVAVAKTLISLHAVVDEPVRYVLGRTTGGPIAALIPSSYVWAMAKTNHGDASNLLSQKGLDFLDFWADNHASAFFSAD